MPLKRIKLPNGDIVELELPYNATQEQVKDFAERLARNYSNYDVVRKVDTTITLPNSRSVELEIPEDLTSEQIAQFSHSISEYFNQEQRIINDVVKTPEFISLKPRDGIDGIDAIGKDGLGVDEVYREANELFTRYTNGEINSLGTLPLPKDGKDGIGITDLYTKEDKIFIDYSDGVTKYLLDLPKDGEDGEDGKPGSNSPKIKNFIKNPNDELIIFMEDGTSHNIGQLPKAKDGVDGIGVDGIDGDEIVKIDIDKRRQLIVTMKSGKVFKAKIPLIDVGGDVVISNQLKGASANLGNAKGDLLAFNGKSWFEVPIGTDDQILKADSSEPLGISWQDDTGVGTFLDLIDTPNTYTAANALYNVNGTTDGVNESTTLLTEPASNQFQISRGTSDLLVTTDCTLDQDLQITSSPNFNSITIANSPVAAADATRKDYVDSLANGLTWKNVVRAATTGNITLSGEQTIDGIAIVNGDRVLVWQQTDLTQNGVYVASTGAWSRSTDMDESDEFIRAAVPVAEGTTQGGMAFVCNNATAPSIGVDDITFVCFSGIVNHNNTAGLQGGAADEYYHLDATEHGFLMGQDQSVKTTSDVTFADGDFTTVAATGTVTGFNLSGTNTGDQTITLTGDVTGSGTGSFATTVVNVPAGGIIGTVDVINGGTGQTTYTNGQLLIGNTTGNTLAKATLTEGEGIDIVNGTGSITISGEDAGTTNKGISELATDAETNTGTDTTRTMTPSNLGQWPGTSNITTLGAVVTGTIDSVVIGGTTPADGTFTNITIPGTTGTIRPGTGFGDKYTMQVWDGFGAAYNDVIKLTSGNARIDITKPSGGTGFMDGIVIGGTTPTTANFTTATSDFFVSEFFQVIDTGEIRTGGVASDTFSITAWDVDGSAYLPFITLTANNTPSLAITNPAGGSSTMDGVVIGGTTPVAGDFTTLGATGNITGANLSGTNTGDQTITLTGDVTGSGTGSFATTVVNVPAGGIIGTVAVTNGGTGQTTYTNGQLLIGNTTGNTLAKATLTEGEGIDITNSTGSITIAGEDASTTNKGISELATDAETNTGTDTARTMTPSNLGQWPGTSNITTLGTVVSGSIDSMIIGGTTPAAGTFTNIIGANVLAAGAYPATSGVEIIPMPVVDQGGGRIFYRELDADDSYGFSVSYNGGTGSDLLNIPSNTFAISRHNNDATGVVVMEIGRTSSDVSFSGAGTFTGLIEATTGGWFKNGDSASLFTDNQILFSFNTGDLYKHAIRTRHNASSNVANTFDFYLWDTTLSSGDDPDNRVFTLESGKAWIRSINEDTDSVLFLATPFNNNSVAKAGIFAEAAETFSRSDVKICVNDNADNTTEVSLSDVVMTFHRDKTVTAASTIDGRSGNTVSTPGIRSSSTSTRYIGFGNDGSLLQGIYGQGAEGVPHKAWEIQAWTGGGGATDYGKQFWYLTPDDTGSASTVKMTLDRTGLTVEDDLIVNGDLTADKVNYRGTIGTGGSVTTDLNNNATRTGGYYDVFNSALNLPPGFPNASNFNVMHVIAYEDIANLGVQILYSADYDNADDFVFTYQRSFDSTAFTDWYVTTMTKAV